MTLETYDLGNCNYCVWWAKQEPLCCMCTRAISDWKATRDFWQPEELLILDLT